MNRQAFSSNVIDRAAAPPSLWKAAPFFQRAAIFALIAILVVCVAYAHRSVAIGSPIESALSRAPGAAESSNQDRERVRYFEQRLARDPNDIDILNRLSSLYLQRLRETGEFSDLSLALRAARTSLASVPASRNQAGLVSRAMAEFSSHEFRAAREDAEQWATLDGTATPYALLGDAYAELGDYSAAGRAYDRLRRGVGAFDENVTTRAARMALLRGRNDAAKWAFARSLASELARLNPSRERIAWYSWQLGDLAFFTGDYRAAAARYDDALIAYPGYFRALASRGRLDVALGDPTRAIADYQAAIAELPDPTFVAELGDVYRLSGDTVSAQKQYDLVRFIGHLTKINGVMYNRQLVMFDADHDTNVEQAYRSARREYRSRRDILGADAVAWSALKAGHIAEARSAAADALRFGTRDPRLLYHAGMIARASNDSAAARRYLEAALDLCPQFDPLQARVARDALRSLPPAV